jgi:hypothetical protein
MAEGWVFTHHMMFFSVPGFGSLVGYKYVTPSGFGVGSLVVCLQLCHPFGVLLVHWFIGRLFTIMSPLRGLGLVHWLVTNISPLRGFGDLFVCL